METVAQMVAAGRTLLAREPGATDDQLRAYLRQEFEVERDAEVSLLRSGLWPLALIARLFRQAPATRTAHIPDCVEEAIRELRANG